MLEGSGRISISFEKGAFYMSILCVVYKFVTSIVYHLSGSGSSSRYDLLSFAMPLVILMAVVILFKEQGGKVNKFNFLLISFYTYAIAISYVSGNYGIKSLFFAVVNMTFWFAVFYITYIYMVRKRFSIESIKRQTEYFFDFYLCFFLVCFLCFMRAYKAASVQAGSDLLINSVYYLLFLLPGVLCSKRKWAPYLGFLLVLVSTVISDKRGAFLLLLLCWTLWVLFTMKSISFSKKLLFIIFAICLTLIGYYAFLKITYNYDINLLDRLESAFNGTDNGSGRTEIWTSTLEMIKNENPIFIILGRGYRAASLNPKYNALSEAHNDFIQVLFDYGVIGFVGLIGICLSLILYAIKMIRWEYKYTYAYIISLIIFFGCSMVSMVLIYPYWFIGMALFWGYVIGGFELYMREKEVWI